MISRTRPATDEDWRKRPMTAVAFYAIVCLGVVILLMGSTMDIAPVATAGALILASAVYARFRTLLAEHNAEEAKK